ncbi:hypothetical protein CcI156_14055 [Frankia sp. CcI156]|uniref:Uncharacterized protein n=1 Tax=Frankia casuarinae (strain DSM 45818 / CECT 9043 / HFP020203 / CcI3) TaxID=106370 RepID=Q2J6N7_FRACC|nr:MULTISPECIES: protein phosphatase 2C domain-containing protein [Frankia]ABD13055.1 hypothetical protein Francci3_3703 [Frankia casuarinae]ETA01766.1 hypothetical protein CcI6DRAFT_02777 [Frankia sp. CcI6]EYT92436.1 hypothetical protein ThrDRAFT_01885 [Frankia casuarinae]KDA42264.1 hypothetical protein BMG523Draft_02894 [Frankia sp. BMG5.23]KEZ35190.1 hypothetical protein CEDDRAFT_03442 [Frankia sp. CeD]
MRVLRSISRSDKLHNEDAAGSRADGLWVIDGATPLHDDPTISGRSSAAWLSGAADAFLATVPWRDRSLPEVVRELIAHVRAEGRRLGLAAGRFPTATIALARQRGPLLDLYLLGDSPVLLRHPGGEVVSFTDPQFDGVEEALLEPVRAELARGIDVAQAYGRAHTMTRERRRQRNTAAGSWILGDVTAAADHAFVTTMPVEPGTELVALSDGYARAVRPFSLVADDAALVDVLARGEQAILLERLRAAERADPDCSRFPRFGMSDDATALYARI